MTATATLPVFDPRPGSPENPHISDPEGHAPSVWAWHAEDGEHIGPGSGYSGIGPGTLWLWTDALRRHGHAIVPNGWRPSNHHIAGIGVGHDDAEFAESGTSHAVWAENEDSVFGRWWERRGGGARYFGFGGGR